MVAKLTEWLFAIVFAVFGAILVIVGIYSAVSSYKFRETALEAIAEVISVSKDTDADGNTRYDVYVSYTVDGIMYNGRYSTSSYVPEGSQKIIYYDRNNPSEMRGSTSSTDGFVFIVVGIPACAVGIGMLISKLNKIGSKKRAIKSGDKIYADFKEVAVNYSYCVNNRCPYIIICTGRDYVTGQNRTFQSKNLWDNPEYIIREKNITTFPVYIDPTNRKNYYLSLENLEVE